MGWIYTLRLELEIDEVWSNYCKGSLATWEMDTLGFYYHDHDLANTYHPEFTFIDFYKESDVAIPKEQKEYKGRKVPIYELKTICGTVLDKSSYKHTVILLTPYGVVNVKCVAEQYSKYDKQLSQPNKETGKKEIIAMLRQRSRPYLFSNSLPPAVVGAGIELFKMLAESDEIHDRLAANVEYFREKMTSAGFDIKPTQSAICAVMLYDAKLSQDFAAKLQEEGVFVTGFYYPVVPKGQARIRVQVSAGHTTEQLDRCVEAFVKVGKELGVLK